MIMNDKIIYKLNCPKCKRITKHIIRCINRTKGVKLTCLNCGRHTQYYNLRKLEDKNIQQTKSEDKQNG